MKYDLNNMEQTQPYTIIVESENKPGVLYRISGIFVRRKINVESLNVYETQTPGISQFSIVINSTQHELERVIQSIRKIVEVQKAEVASKQEISHKKT